jgi:hypothetical protein
MQRWPWRRIAWIVAGAPMTAAPLAADPDVLSRWPPLDGTDTS